MAVEKDEKRPALSIKDALDRKDLNEQRGTVVADYERAGKKRDIAATSDDHDAEKYKQSASNTMVVLLKVPTPSAAGKHRRGHKSPIRRAIERICDERGADAREVINALQDADYMADLFEHASSPIDVQILEVTEKTIRYRQRDGRDKEIGFKQIGDHVRTYSNDRKK